MSAPRHLNSRSKRLMREIEGAYELGPDHLELVLRLCEAVTRLDSIREALDTEGLTIPDRFGQARAHPLAAVEVQTRAQVARFLDQLALDHEAPEARQVRSSASAMAQKRWAR